MLRIGLTGGIGSGKSTVAAQMQALGAGLVDTDAIARQLTAPGGRAMPAIVQAFGPEMAAPDGSLDRARMRELAFGNPDVRHRLQGVLHPLIGEECERQARAHGDLPMLVFDVPLLVESGRWRGLVNRVLVVDASEDVQVRRVMARSGWPEETVRAVIAQQASRAQRRAAADAVIHNEELGMDALALCVQSLWQRWVRPGLR
ncbi:dephospho-CoA kinase [Pseudacidovorax intermedius]|uniref:Dephospho-CoA kinase n=1 Tax=Pseudacidovorax intermedius TaxID=433924 RepID=A0A370FKN7_9BURK|nr:dephospho-CoA kinase [Pseudacidovorax intermedius]RDI26349.1 dephospho-CoA kinase [Pseudacidovorax intermedius]